MDSANINLARLEDGDYGYSTLGETTVHVDHSGFGFSGSGAVINGIEVRIGVSPEASVTYSWKLTSISLFNAGFTRVGSKTPASTVPAGPSEIVLGGSSDNWGGTLLPADLAGLLSFVRFDSTPGIPDVRMGIDYVKIKVWLA